MQAWKLTLALLALLAVFAAAEEMTLNEDNSEQEYEQDTELLEEGDVPEDVDFNQDFEDMVWSPKVANVDLEDDVHMGCDELKTESLEE
eukprot:CAMPEP_0114554328 /NCGR_PEP_ID=MMETSP0114-20121206/8154_1 /TAXON_ID=31324 /ORGANISM="Goniomonas sp, Strain m" /LENGTH=88 /DNA_ID=CAMNT_0001739373 /DNA_START=17 /DNA_END=283 /DNA_ORIENTATION=+